ncbi:AMP-binding protein [Nocardioides bruguierae]|uniref:AMP-binding protein n=1 Tax=Nocardioides bruguierae TaxID=2945102 RepID=UPI0020219E15|nr:AMP-binding protein [Nocardioides bruguierae]MCL8023818.1 AMP-binding protein [Nocardioides bruguierae]
MDPAAPPVTLPAEPAEVVDVLEAWLSAPHEPGPLVVRTSGSTGTPKRVLLPRASVLASARASAARVGASGPWLLTLPAGYVAGVNVVARSLVAGHRPVLADDHGSFAEAAAALVAAHPERPRFVSLVPTQLHRMLGGAGAAAEGATSDDVWALRTFHTVLLGGGPVDAALRERAAAAGVRVVATYGSAETSGGCVYDGRPLDGTRVRVDDDGRVLLAGTTLFAGYEGEPGRVDRDLTDAAVVDGWFRTSDAGRITEHGRLQVLGRLDDVVVTGGLNVPAPAVAAALRATPGVAQAEVVGVPDEEWGNVLVALVVPADADAPPPLETLRDAVAETRPRAWAPRRLVLLEELPLLANGKPDRLALQALAAAAVVEQRGAQATSARRDPTTEDR